MSTPAGKRGICVKSACAPILAPLELARPHLRFELFGWKDLLGMIVTRGLTGLARHRLPSESVLDRAKAKASSSSHWLGLGFRV